MLCLSSLPTRRGQAEPQGQTRPGLARTGDSMQRPLPADGRLAVCGALCGTEGLSHLSLCQAKGQAPDFKSFGKFSDLLQINPVHLTRCRLRICGDVFKNRINMSTHSQPGCSSLSSHRAVGRPPQYLLCLSSFSTPSSCTSHPSRHFYPRVSHSCLPCHFPEQGHNSLGLNNSSSQQGEALGRGIQTHFAGKPAHIQCKDKHKKVSL